MNLHLNESKNNDRCIENLHDILLIPDPFDGALFAIELLLTETVVDCEVVSEFGEVTGLKDVFMLANTVSRCFGSKYCCIIARQLIKTWKLK